ncbi:MULTISPECIES: tRNA epoxyqueuosine(34) reductase QueG [unclassified Modicisalibacter]|uniref:tRNA epoxyqueuosine(34) reductase QueG n=1 Tax=unclassified Modicisalibacter TaxID=2679913 RepID=UPI001CCADADF|nr:MULTISPECIES: tRNA epoxyqueuosine(34) reductase QueG [unclassified Modicisalibacter]MBZ9557431.1 tRNA epoxyqueuosine(34) reductase QueG [Modicisalibacter sp. R2A 31.J]MBZ9573903.1 tRNA epoxyqueuosine(34) reductase QueG [Modicisalibacter sp. MOD 31.J]
MTVSHLRQPDARDLDDPADLAARIKQWGRELGFQQVGITDTDLASHERYLERWLAAGYQGEMDYMTKHGTKRTRPAELVPGTLRVISVRMDYLPPEVETTRVLGRPQKAYVSRYALGRDYHKLIRKRLAELAKRIEAEVGDYGYRAFVDSAPVMERALAQKAGLGWFGKNAMLLNPQAGSLFFLGELYTDLPLPVDTPFEREHCGSCSACQTACPTGAIVDDKVIDARRCISYLTIELHGSIPEHFREAIGNRVYGCDDCQLVCPFTRFTRASDEPDFAPRHDLDRADLVTLFAWSEEEFLDKTQGSAIRRIGYERWLRNLAVGLGNAPWSRAVEGALHARLAYPSELVREHVRWALDRQHRKRPIALSSG